MKHLSLCLFAILFCITTKAECNYHLDRDSVLQRVDELKALVDKTEIFSKYDTLVELQSVELSYRR